MGTREQLDLRCHRGGAILLDTGSLHRARWRNVQSTLQPDSLSGCAYGMRRPLTLDVGRAAGGTKADKCPSPIAILTASLEARVLASPEAPISPTLLDRVGKALGDGGSSKPEYCAGDLNRLSWLLRTEIFERTGAVTEELRHLTVSCRGLYENVLQAAALKMVRIGGRRAQLWRNLKNQCPGASVWRDWVQQGAPGLLHLVSTEQYSRSRRAFDLLVGCCTQADRPDFLKELIAHASPFWDASLCAGCTSTMEWCRCTDGPSHGAVTPLALCCINNHSKSAQVLLEAGAELTVASSVPGSPSVQPIHLACMHGSASTVGIICAFDKCAASMATKADRETPLMLAVRKNDLNTCRVLVAQPYTCIKATNARGLTVSDLITHEHSDALVYLLADAGAVTNSRMEVRLDRRHKASVALSLPKRILSNSGGATFRSTSGFATVRSIQSLNTVGSMSTFQDSAAGSEPDEGTADNSRSGSECWSSESSSDSDEPVSRAALKARSTDVIKRGMVIPRLSFSTECLRTPRTARQNCGLPATIAGRLPGCEQSLFMQRSARMRANFEDSESSDDSADSSPRSDESDCDWTPDRKPRTLQPNSVPSLNLQAQIG